MVAGDAVINRNGPGRKAGLPTRVYGLFDWHGEQAWRLIWPAIAVQPHHRRTDAGGNDDGLGTSAGALAHFRARVRIPALAWRAKAPLASTQPFVGSVSGARARRWHAAAG